MIILRPYQVQTIAKVREEIRKGNKNVLLVAPVGSGKTAMATFMMREAKAKALTVWFVVHKRELLIQAYRSIERMGLSAGLVSAGFPLSPRENIQVVSIGSLKSRKDKIKAPDMLIYDEAHHCGADTWVKMFNEYEGKFQIGLTATPWRLDRKGLGRYFSAMVEAPEVEELIQMGNLSNYKAYAQELVDTSKTKTSMGDFDLKDFEKAATKTFTSDVVQEYMRHVNGKRAILFASSLEYSRLFVEKFIDNGIPAAHLDGEMSNADRDRVVKQLETGEIKVLCNFGIVTEGFDVPAVEAVILARPTMSLSLYIQMVGRALRPSPEKEHAVILDHVGNTVRHGLIDEKRIWTLTDREKKKNKSDALIAVKVCKSCFAANRSFNRFCEFCGFEFEKKSAVEIKHDDAQLVEVNKKALERSRKKEQAMAQTLEELIALGKTRGYSVGWAHNIFKARMNKRR